MSRLFAVLLPILVGVNVAACGASATGADDPEAVRAAMLRWAATTEPAEACQQISRGFALFLTEGHPDSCAARVGKKLQLPGWDVTIKRIRFQDDQALVDAVPVGHPDLASTWYYVRVGRDWKLNSIGVNVGAPPPGGVPDPPAG